MEAGNTGRAGGVYIPPAKLRRMEQQVEDKSSQEYQRMQWEKLRKSINGIVNKVNLTNIKTLLPGLFKHNIIRGRGLFCRSVMKAQMASQPFSNVYAALAAVVNTKMPEIGELLLKRVITQFQRAYKRNDKGACVGSVKFIAHLVNQAVAHELIALELITLLLERPSDDSVEVAVNFTKECGAMLQELSPQGLHAIFERFRTILHEGEIDKRVQYMIEGLFAVRKSAFKEFPAIATELDLVDADDQVTHELSLDEKYSRDEKLDFFHPDPNFEVNEKRYGDIRREILGDSDDSDGDDEDEEDDEDEDDEEDIKEQLKQQAIEDETKQDLVNLRRTIYLTIMSSANFEECTHKILKMKIPEDKFGEISHMLVECCSQERTYLPFYGLIGQRFCHLQRIFQELFVKQFEEQYAVIYRYETNKLRNIARFFAHLFYTDAFGWEALSCIHLNEEETTSSSRIFIKILFQEIVEYMGMKKMVERLRDPFLQAHFEGIFPRDHPKKTRFSINFFTSIGLGALTEPLREFLRKMPKDMLAQERKRQREQSSDESSSSSSSSDSGSSSGSDSDSGSGSGSGSGSDSSGSSSGSARSSRSRGRRGRRRRSVSRSASSPRRRSRSGEARGRGRRASSPSPQGRRRPSPSPSPRREQSRRKSPSPPQRQRGKEESPVRRSSGEGGRVQEDRRRYYDRDARRSPPRTRRGRDSVSRSPPRRARVDRDDSRPRRRGGSGSRTPPRRRAPSSESPRRRRDRSFSR